VTEFALGQHDPQRSCNYVEQHEMMATQGHLPGYLPDASKRAFLNPSLRSSNEFIHRIGLTSTRQRNVAFENSGRGAMSGWRSGHPAIAGRPVSRRARTASASSGATIGF
jgi:hypothetical protein